MKGKASQGIFAYIAYIAVFCATYIVVGSYDIGSAAVSCADPIAQHQNERMLSIVYDLSVLVGLFALWLFNVKSIPGGMFYGAALGLGAGGIFVFGAVEGLLPVMLAVAILIASVAFVLLRRPFFSAFLAVSVVFASAQVAFFLVP